MSLTLRQLAGVDAADFLAVGHDEGAKTRQTIESNAGNALASSIPAIASDRSTCAVDGDRLSKLNTQDTS